MALAQRLDLRQSQALVMTPQLQQAIKLLQLSNLELADFIEREIEQNPLLERDDGDGDIRIEGGIDADLDRDDMPLASSDRQDTSLLTGSGTLPGEGDGPLDSDSGDQNLWSSNEYTGEGSDGESLNWKTSGGGGGDFSDEEDQRDRTLASEKSLSDHLNEQVGADFADPVERAIASYMIGLLDDCGWFTAGCETVADSLGCTLEQVESVLDRLQRLDPPGIFARSLKECLALQLREKDRLDPAMQALLDNLELLARRDLAALRRICGVDNEDLADMVGEIKALNPKPGERFEHEAPPTLIPDVLMRPAADGGWEIELNSDTLPRVLVNRRYHAAISRGGLRREDKDYLSEQLQSANWLVKSLHQRATTIVKVAGEIVRQQDAFFRHGIGHLRPLVLRDIADAIGMHESTVSRVTANKYIAGPRGVFELKFFFSAAISAMDGAESHSAEAVRFRIKSLIDAEPADGVLSDDRIVEILQNGGIDIARRTVAKYRESMRIPSSVQRRREKSLGL
ncbi:RNA polymerase factor sigma-54 [Oceanibaculum indicum]|nr:RNA polymerase factor sigma-54 [Oceanibaculum indicum]